MTEAERKGIVDAVIRSGALAALAVDHALTEMADIVESSRDAAIAAEQRAEKAEAALGEIRGVLGRKFHRGTGVINCVAHARLPFDQRPEDCRLCRADIVNHMRYAIRVNEWLNKNAEDALATLRTLEGREEKPSGEFPG